MSQSHSISDANASAPFRLWLRWLVVLVFLALLAWFLVAGPPLLP